MMPPRGCSSASRTQTKFGMAGNLPNVITHAKFEINWYKLYLWRKVEVSCFSTTTADAINTAKPVIKGSEISSYGGDLAK